MFLIELTNRAMDSRYIRANQLNAALLSAFKCRASSWLINQCIQSETIQLRINRQNTGKLI